MTYEEYKNGKVSNNKNNNFIKRIISKLLTITIFTMIIITISNYSESFKNFIIDDVLNKTMDFSKINNITSKLTSIFDREITSPVIKNEDIKSEKYLDGIKYFVNNNSEIILNDSGIVTYIGEKEGYNNTVIIQQSNGYYAWYGNIKESIKLYDYIESGTVIGKALNNEYYYVLYKDDKPITNES